MWFFGAYQPALTNYERTVDASVGAEPGRGRRATPSRISRSSTSPRTRRRRSATTSAPAWRSTTAGRRPKACWRRRTASIPPARNYTKDTKFPNWALSGDLNYVRHAEVRRSASAAATTSRTATTSTSPNEPRYTWTTTNNINFLDVPADLQHGTGFTSIPTQHRVRQRSRSADARVLPRRRHRRTCTAAASTRSSSACRSTASATRC